MLILEGAGLATAASPLKGSNFYIGILKTPLFHTHPRPPVMDLAATVNYSI